jgi:hypothetical protein
MLTNSSKVETKILPGENHFIVWTEYEAIKDVLLSLE